MEPDVNSEDAPTTIRHVRERAVDPAPEVAELQAAATLEALADALGIRQAAGKWSFPELEIEEICGITAREYLLCALTQTGRYDSFISGVNEGLRSAIKRPAFILDVGCGTGVLTLALAQYHEAAQILAFDSSADMISASKELRGRAFRSVQERVRFVQGSVYETTELLDRFQTRPPDLVVCRNVLQRLRNRQKALEQMWSVLQPEGHLFLSAFCGDLKSEAVRQELLASVKRRLVTPDGHSLVNFARCYLLAVLQAPPAAEYQALISTVVGNHDPAVVQTRIDGYTLTAIIQRRAE